MATLAQRQEMAHIGYYLVSKASLLHYRQARPMASRQYSWAAIQEHLNSGGEASMDCSETFTEACRWAGLEDPNGMGYNGYGWTGSIWAHCPHVSSLKLGDPVVWGYNGNEHVAWVIEEGPDPLLCSMGSEIGPLAIRLSAESRYHSSQPRTFCSIENLGPVEKPKPPRPSDYSVLYERKWKVKGRKNRISELETIKAYDRMKKAGSKVDGKHPDMDAASHEARLLFNRIWDIVHKGKPTKATIDKRWSKYNRQRRASILWRAYKGIR